MCLFHFLKVRILNVVIVFRAVVLGLLVSLCVLVRLCALIHLCACVLHYGVQVVYGVVYCCHVTVLVSVFQLLESGLNCRFLVCRNLVAVVLQEVSVVNIIESA